jgi:hypothetical protein
MATPKQETFLCLPSSVPTTVTPPELKTFLDVLIKGGYYIDKVITNSVITGTNPGATITTQSYLVIGIKI